MKRQAVALLCVAALGLAACEEDEDQAPSAPTSPAMQTVQAVPPSDTMNVECLVDPPQGVAPHTADFRASPSGGILPDTYVWNFGDGGSGSGLETKHTFGGPGVYTVRLTAIAGSRTATCTARVEVAETLVAVCRANPAVGVAPFTTRLAAKPLFCRSDGCEWRWDFGDGQTLVSTTEDNPVHEYVRRGTYDAEALILTDRGRIRGTCRLRVTAQ